MTELTTQNIKEASFGKKFKKLLENIFFFFFFFFFFFDLFSKNYRRLIKNSEILLAFILLEKGNF